MYDKKYDIAWKPLKERREERAKIRAALEELNEVETWDVHVRQAIHLLEEVLDNK